MKPNKVYKSRRGDYTLDGVPDLMVITDPKLELAEARKNRKARVDMVASEIKMSRDGILEKHKYWKDEPLSFVVQYENFYILAWQLGWLNKPEDRHNVLVNPYTCLTLVQYHAGKLIAYSRSTDSKNGLHADKLVLLLLAEHIEEHRPDCPVNEIYWLRALPHTYVEPGIARLKDGESYD